MSRSEGCWSLALLGNIQLEQTCLKSIGEQNPKFSILFSTLLTKQTIDYLSTFVFSLYYIELKL